MRSRQPIGSTRDRRFFCDLRYKKGGNVSNWSQTAVNRHDIQYENHRFAFGVEHFVEFSRKRTLNKHIIHIYIYTYIHIYIYK